MKIVQTFKGTIMFKQYINKRKIDKLLTKIDTLNKCKVHKFNDGFVNININGCTYSYSYPDYDYELLLQKIVYVLVERNLTREIVKLIKI